MIFTDEMLDVLFDFARKFYGKVRLQITAGWGCTVIELFPMSAGPLAKIPLKRWIV